MVNQSRPPVSPESSTVRMWGCCGRADLPLESLGAEGGGQFRVEELEGDRPVVAEVLGQPDRRHPPAAELALQRIAVAEALAQCGDRVGHWARMRGMMGGKIPGRPGWGYGAAGTARR